jgi:hypothetical protein
MSRRTLIRAGLTALLAIPGLVLTGAGSESASAAATARIPTWHVEYRQPGMDITAVSAAGPDSAWAIGINRGRGTGLLLHWNGSHWRSMHYRGEAADLPTAIFALSPTDFWLFVQNSYQALHWSSGQWTELQMPVAGYPMAVLSDTSIWIWGGNVPACDVSSNAGRGCTATSHWNGATWTSYPLAAQNIANVSASSKAGVWLVGESYTRTRALPHHGGYVTTSLPYVYRWTGSAWQRSGLAVRRTSARPSIVAGSLKRVFVAEASAAHPTACAMHFDGSKWRPLYLPGQRGACDWAVSDGHGGLWLYGTLGPGINFVHWTGKRFVTTRRFRPSPSFNTDGFLVAAVPRSSAVWAFGSYCKVSRVCRVVGLIARIR